jgi:hypothetical protein
MDNGVSKKQIKKNLQIFRFFSLHKSLFQNVFWHFVVEMCNLFANKF